MKALHTPFGMITSGRSYSTGSGYRYGFNGKENDNEVKGEGNQQDYGFRIYDPRLGRFLSVDPLTGKYPWYTPYQFAGNMPIKFIDLDGLEPAEPGKKAGEVVFGRNGDGPAQSWKWDGKQWQDNSSLEQVVIKNIGHKKLPKPEQNKISPPYAEVTSILLDRNRNSYEKLKSLRKTGMFPINPTESRKLDGALLKNILGGAVLEVLDKGFTALDMVNLGMSNGKGSEAPLELPFVGGVTQMMVNDLVAETDQWILENALSQGYMRFARVMNSPAGKRSGLTGVYVTKDVMLSILQTGGMNFKIHNVTGAGGTYPDTPNLPSASSENRLDYFIFFPTKNKEEIIKNFGVLPIK